MIFFVVFKTRMKKKYYLTATTETWCLKKNTTTKFFYTNNHNIIMHSHVYRFFFSIIRQCSSRKRTKFAKDGRFFHSKSPGTTTCVNCKRLLIVISDLKGCSSSENFSIYLLNKLNNQGNYSSRSLMAKILLIIGSYNRMEVDAWR